MKISYFKLVGHSEACTIPFVSIQYFQQSSGKLFFSVWQWILDTNDTCSSDAEIRTNLVKSLLLNTLSLISIYTYDILLHPLLKDEEKWLHRNLGRFYQIGWLLPVVGISFYLNVRMFISYRMNKAEYRAYYQMSWCNVIAKRTYILHCGSHAVAQPPRSYANILNQLATSAYRVVMVFTSVVVSYGLKKIPYLGFPLEFAFLCWVDS